MKTALAHALCFAAPFLSLALADTTSVAGSGIDAETKRGLRGASLTQRDEGEQSLSSLERITYRFLKHKVKHHKNRNNADAASAEPEIIGGTAAQPGQYPYFTTVISSSQWICGAALVAPDMLITAGHCSDAFKKGAVVGTTKRGVKISGSVEVKIVQQILYPGWTNFTHNDVMLMKISPPVTSITPVTINFNTSLPSVNESLEIIGFGATANNGPVSNVLMQASVYEVPSSKCQQYYGTRNVVPSEMVCVVNEAPLHQVCDGDSGGPLLGKGSSGETVTFGVTSWGSTSCYQGYSVYTRLSGYQSFITNTICQNSASPPSYFGCNGSSGSGGTGGGSGGSTTGSGRGDTTGGSSEGSMRGGRGRSGGGGHHHSSRPPKHSTGKCKSKKQKCFANKSCCSGYCKNGNCK